jgi:hypothetical protein
MQFTLISFSILGLFAVQARAAAVDAAIERRTGMAALAGCVCSKDKTGAEGQHVAEGLRWYQCQYAEGACAWNDVRMA